MSRVIKASQVAIDLEEASPDQALPSENGRAAADAEAVTELLREAKREAQRLLLRSQEIAARRLAQAAAKEAAVEKVLHEAREAGRREGYDEGYRAGFAQGRDEALEEYRRLVEAARTILEKAREAQWRLERQAEEEIVQLALAVAEKMTRRALAEDDARSILLEMLSKAEGSSAARVRLSKEVLERLRAQGELPTVTAGGCALEFVADESLAGGDVVIETDWGLIDGRVKSRWGRIVQGLDLTELSADDAC